jgi:ligand-binding SRPBCC domain-containing protein
LRLCHYSLSQADRGKNLGILSAADLEQAQRPTDREMMNVMAVYFECVTRSDGTAEELFDLARDISLHEESQAAAGEKATAGVIDGLIGPGQEVTWKARHFGIPFSLTSRVIEFEFPRRFVDEQTRGPFRSFRHEHIFEADGSGSVMIDRVNFSAPFGVLGLLAERLVLAKYMRRVIEDRSAFLVRR